MSKIASDVKIQLQAISACQRGIAMVEFAYVMPIIVLIYMGSITAFDAIRADRQVGFTADSIADLISRETTINDEFRDNLFQAATTLMGRFASAGTLGVTMTAIGNDDGDLTVLWSEANANAPVLADDDLETLTQLPTIPENESIILIRVATQYAPLLIDKASPPIDFSETVIARPRFVPQIVYE